MNINNLIKLIAGTFIIASVLLSHFVSVNWLFFTAFVGVNLIQSSITKWCLLEKILLKLGVKQGADNCSVKL